MSRQIIPSQILDELQSQLQNIKYGDKKIRDTIYKTYAHYGSRRTLSRHLQFRFGRSKKQRYTSGISSPLLIKASKLVSEKKLHSHFLTGRWLSTNRALTLLQEEGKLPQTDLSVNSINRIIAEQNYLNVTKHYNTINCPSPNFKHIFDTSGSTCLRTVSFDPPIIETIPAMDSSAEKNHPLTGRRRLFLFALVDAYSGYLMAEYRSIPAPNSHVMAEFLLKNWKATGAPEYVLSDNGAENKGVVDNLLIALNIGKIKSKPRHPQARGGAERVFRTVFADFESVLLMRLGVGSRMSLDELNDKLRNWLSEDYNTRKARLGKSVSSNRYDSFQHRALNISIKSHSKGTKISTPVMPRHFGAVMGYTIVGSSLSVTGKKVKAVWSGSDSIRGKATIKAFLRTVNIETQKVDKIIYMKSFELDHASSQQCEFIVPDTKGWPVYDLGFEIDSEFTGDVFLNSVTITGEPNIKYDSSLYSELSKIKKRTPLGWIHNMDIINSIVNSDKQQLRLIKQGHELGLLTTGDRSWKNYSFEAELSPKCKAESFGLITRYQGLQRYVSVEMKAGKLQIIENYYDKKVLKEIDFSWLDEKTHKLKVICKGSQLQVELDKKLVLEAQPEELTCGGVGFLISKGNILVTNIQVNS